MPERPPFGNATASPVTCGIAYAQACRHEYDKRRANWVSLTTTATGTLTTRLTMREMISDTPPLVHTEVGQRREWPKASADCLLSLAAAPAFAIMALLTGIQDGGMPGMQCLAAHDASPLTGMVPMYLLMSTFHLSPWLRLIANWRSGAQRHPNSSSRP
jgi:hypothetical protein